MNKKLSCMIIVLSVLIMLSVSLVSAELDTVEIATVDVFSIGLAVLGAASNVLLVMYDEREISVRKVIAHIGIGFIVGFIFPFTGLPNHLNTFLAGYAAPDILRRLVHREPEKEAEKD